MLILAMSVIGKEYCYISETAHKVSKASAKKICDICNENKYMFSKHPDCHWFVHDVDSYTYASDYASFQSFTIRKGLVKAWYR